MADSAERDIIYRIKVTTDPANDRVLRGIMDAQKQAEESIKTNAKKSATERVKNEKDVAAEREKSSRSSVRSAERQYRKEVDLAKKSADAQKRALEEVNKKRQAYHDASVRFQGKLNETVATGTEGVLKLVQGYTMLGISNKKTSEEMLQALVKLQGAFMILRGGIDVWRTMTIAAELYTLQTQKAAAANTLASVTAGGMGKGAAVGAGANVAGSAAGGVATGALASIATTIAAAAAAIGGVVLAINGIREVMTGQTGPGSQTDTIGRGLIGTINFTDDIAAATGGQSSLTSGPNALGIFGDAARYKASRIQTERMQAARNAELAANEQRKFFRRRADLNRLTDYSLNVSSPAEYKLSMIGERFSGMDRSRRTLRELRSYQSSTQEAMGGLDEGGASYRELQQKDIDIQNRITDELRKQRDIQAGITQEKIRGLETDKRDLELKRSQLVSFGLRSRQEQRGLLKLFNRAKTQGIESLNRDQALRLGSIGSPEATAMQEQWALKQGLVQGGEAIVGEQAGFAKTIDVDIKEFEIRIKDLGDFESRIEKKIIAAADSAFKKLQFMRDSSTRRNNEMMQRELDAKTVAQEQG